MILGPFIVLVGSYNVYGDSTFIILWPNGKETYHIFLAQLIIINNSKYNNGNYKKKSKRLLNNIICQIKIKLHFYRVEEVFSILSCKS